MERWDLVSNSMLVMFCCGLKWWKCFCSMVVFVWVVVCCKRDLIVIGLYRCVVLMLFRLVSRCWLWVGKVLVFICVCFCCFRICWNWRMISCCWRMSVNWRSWLSFSCIVLRLWWWIRCRVWRGFLLEIIFVEFVGWGVD